MALTAACGTVREALSARLDGEASPIPAGTLEAHLRDCADCSRYDLSLGGVHRAVRVSDAEPVPDLTALILAAVQSDETAATRRRRSRAKHRLRALVAMAGLVQLVVATPLLFGAASAGMHSWRDLAGLQLALGVGFVLTALQPWRAAGVLPVAAVVAGFAVVTGVLDVVMGIANPVAELSHLSEVGGVTALAALRRRTSGRPVARPAPAVAS